MRSGRHPVELVAAAVCSCAAVAGASYLLLGHAGTAAGARVALRRLAPVAFRGVLHDTSGRAVANASVQLTASDTANAKVGEKVKVRLLARTRTDAAGRFTIRQSPTTPFIRKLAAENGGWVNFELLFRARGKFMPWSIPRKVSHGAWLAEDNPNVPAALEVERLTFKALGG